MTDLPFHEAADLFSLTEAEENEALEFHEAAAFFPLMEGEEFEKLKADIQAHGLHEPIWTYQGKVIDGRNRFRACRATGVARGSASGTAAARWCRSWSA